MKRKSCFFIGHRDVSIHIFPKLLQSIEYHILEYGVTDFFVGGYGDFDRIVAQALITSKIKHPEIVLFLLLPYHPEERAVSIPNGFDNSFYPPDMENIPRRIAIVRANRYMIEHVDYLIAYAWHPASNARNLLEYAKIRMKKGLLKVENLAESLKADRPVKGKCSFD